MTNDILANLSSYQDERTTRLLTWLFEQYKGDTRRIASAIQMHPATVSKIFGGNYPAIDQVVDRIEAHKARVDRMLVTDFVESETSKNIFEILYRVKTLGTMALIQGPSRRGKTHAIKEWIKRNNDPLHHVYYVDVPPEQSTRALLCEIARAIGTARDGNRYGITERICDRLTNRDVIIFDESARLLKYKDPTDGLELIRRMHDQQGVGVCFCATNWFESEINGGRLAVYFEQLVGRLEDSLIIPAKVSRAEVKAFLSEHTQGTPSNEIIRIGLEIVNGKGKLASLSRHINDALLLARDIKSDTLSADHLRAAVRARQDSGIWSEPETR